MCNHLGDVYTRSPLAAVLKLTLAVDMTLNTINQPNQRQQILAMFTDDNMYYCITCLCQCFRLEVHTICSQRDVYKWLPTAVPGGRAYWTLMFYQIIQADSSGSRVPSYRMAAKTGNTYLLQPQVIKWRF